MLSEPGGILFTFVSEHLDREVISEENSSKDNVCFQKCKLFK